MVQNPNVHGTEGTCQGLRDVLVGTTRLGDPTGMVVKKNNCGGVMRECRLNYFPGINSGIGKGAAEESLHSNQSMPTVQMQDAKLLVIARPQVEAEVFACESR